MREILDIVDTFERVKRHGKTGVLASVVRVEGSTYRRPGARALFLPGDEVIGLIGGGCLENDLLLQAEKVRKNGRPKRIGYDNTSDDEIVWGLGLGCNGKVEVLLEPVGPGQPGPLEFIARCLKDRMRGVMATVIRSLDSSRLASRWMCDAGGAVQWSSNWDDRVDLSGQVAEVKAARKPQVVAIRDREILVEPVELPIRLLVVGAGPDALPLVTFADRLGWSVEVFDHREAFARADRFPGARSVSVVPVKDMARVVQTDRRTAVVLMTHHFLHDCELLRGLLRSNAGYCGVLGPKARLERLLDTLKNNASASLAQSRKRVKGPVGLDIGAETPEEIALSIVAEIQACFAGRDGMPLSRKAGPIHA
ncbi:MAG: XdhC family protein [Methylohalobius sp. ZOD2]